MQRIGNNIPTFSPALVIFRKAFHAKKNQQSGPNAAFTGDAIDEATALDDGAELISVADTLNHLLGLLDQTHRDVAVRRIKGDSNKAIARELNCSLATVERRMKMIREIWNDNIDETER